MTSKFAIFSLCSLVGLSAASASVSFLMDADIMADSTGTPISVSSAVAIVIDTNRDGFGAVVPGKISAGDFLNGVDDLIVFVDIPDNTSGEAGLVFIATPGITLGDGSGSLPATGDQVAVYWFPNVTLDGVYSAGQEYGMYTNLAEIDGSKAWVVPGDPTTNYVLAFATSDSANLAGSNDPSAGHAVMTVIPEPGVFSLFALALGGFILRRRR